MVVCSRLFEPLQVSRWLRPSESPCSCTIPWTHFVSSPSFALCAAPSWSYECTIPLSKLLSQVDKPLILSSVAAGLAFHLGLSLQLCIFSRYQASLWNSSDWSCRSQSSTSAVVQMIPQGLVVGERSLWMLKACLARALRQMQFGRRQRCR